MSARIHRCSECGHKSEDHCRQLDWGQCSMGGCACSRTAGEVRSTEPEITIPSWPAYDAATGRWATERVSS